ncbi:MAG TPA: protein prkA, partial [Bacillales bacterium]|nr:protein prkA [Bacillales bacterium]
MKWEGTFSKYLEKVKDNPAISQHAHARIFNMIAAAGVERKGNQNQYSFFNEEIYGLDDSIQTLV